MTCGQVWWPILGICALHLTHPSAHTVGNTHTPWEQLGVLCLAQGSHLSRGIEGGENARYSLPHRQFLPDPRFEPTTSGYTSLMLYPLGHDCPNCVYVCVYIYIYTLHRQTDRQRDISLVRSSRSFLWLIIASRPSFSLAGPILAFLPY